MGVCACIQSGADGDHGIGNGNGDCDSESVSNSDHSTRSTYTSRLATSMSASKLPQTWRVLLAEASTNSEISIV